jgi:acyl dehydratase
MQFDNEKMSVNYGLNKVRFLNPVISGSRIRDRIVLSNFEDKGNGRYLLTHTHTIEIEGQEKPACIAEALTMTFI